MKSKNFSFPNENKFIEDLMENDPLTSLNYMMENANNL